jgi:SAM-dependent methyltransferase
MNLKKFDSSYVEHSSHCPLCGGMNLKTEQHFDILDLALKWKNQYDFVPIPGSYFDEDLKKNQCQDCGLYSYSPILPDYPGFYDKLYASEIPYDVNNFWEYGIFSDSLKRFDEEEFQYFSPRILEIGCGQGRFLDVLKEKGVRAQGADFSKIALKACKAKGHDVSGHSLKWFKYNPFIECFDAIVMNQVLEHIAEIKEFLQDVYDILNVGGRLYLAVPNPEQTKSTGDSALNFPPHHQIDFSKKSLEWIAQKYGYSIRWYMKEPLNKRIYLKYKKNVEGIDVPEGFKINKKDFNRVAKSNSGHTHAICFVKEK